MIIMNNNKNKNEIHIKTKQNKITFKKVKTLKETTATR